MNPPHQTARCLGKLPAVNDPRIPKLADHLRWDNLANPPERTSWIAEMPKGGIPMLANDRFGCCVPASVLHQGQMVDLYVHSHGSGNNHIRVPTDAECLQAYSDVTGFDRNNPATDQGTRFLGPGGMLEHWVTKGVTIGGVLNKATNAAVVNIKNQREVQKAIELFGFVFTGANLTQANVDSSFMWLAGGPFIGGHEFLTVGCGPGYYEVLTWDGIWRYPADFLEQQVDEMCVVSTPAFFSAHGIDPAGVSLAAITADLKMLG